MASAKPRSLPPGSVTDRQERDVELAAARTECALDELVRIRHERGIAGEEAALGAGVEQVHVRGASPAIEAISIAAMRRDRGMNGNVPNRGRATGRQVFGVTIASP